MTLDQVIDTLSYEDLAALKNMIESGHGNDAIAVLEDFGWDRKRRQSRRRRKGSS